MDSGMKKEVEKEIESTLREIEYTGSTERKLEYLRGLAYAYYRKGRDSKS
jgi:hypothetical protein